VTSGGRATIAALACAVAASAAMAWILASRGDELGAALDRLPLSVFLAATALHVLTLFIRAEAWGVTLRATAGRAAARRTLHTAAAGGYLVGTVEIHASLPVRMAIMRRLAPDDAPGLRGMVLSDMPLFWLEVLYGCVLGLLAATAIPRLAWWVAPLALLVAAAVAVGLRVTHQRLGHHRLIGGLAILADRRERWVLAALCAGIAVLMIARVGILAAACGLPTDPPELILLYLAIGVLGILPVGPASNPAATLAVAGSTAGVGAAGAAGLAIAASTIAAVILYAFAMALVLAWGGLTFRRRQALSKSAAATVPDVLRRPPG
jgi:hypothetical protein